MRRWRWKGAAASVSRAPKNKVFGSTDLRRRTKSVVFYGGPAQTTGKKRPAVEWFAFSIGRQLAGRTNLTRQSQRGADLFITEPENKWHPDLISQQLSLRGTGGRQRSIASFPEAPPRRGASSESAKHRGIPPLLFRDRKWRMPGPQDSTGRCA